MLLLQRRLFDSVGITFFGVRSYNAWKNITAFLFGSSLSHIFIKSYSYIIYLLNVVRFF